MIQSVRELPITLTNNSAPITFTNDTIRTRSCNCCTGWLCHQEGSPLYQLLKGGYYEVDFNVNVSSSTPGVVAFGLYQDGFLVPRNNCCFNYNCCGRCGEFKIHKNNTSLLQC